MASSRKEEKEAFVTGHEGSNPFEVFLVCLSAPLGVAAYSVVAAYIKRSSRVSGNANASHGPRGPVRAGLDLMMETIIICLPIVINQTSYLIPYGLILMTIQALVLVASVVFSKTQTRNQSTHSGSTAARIQAGPSSTTISKARRDYLTIYRSSILVLTFVAILAVDFRVFPRKHCKTEVAGYGLMDVGAASFCFSAGLVSKPSRHGYASTNAQHVSIFKQLWQTLPLIILGMVRLITNKGLEYQEHVSEYGLHWNFFFTLASMAVLAPWARRIESAMLSILPAARLSFKISHRPTWILPTVLLFLYQSALSFGSVQDYIENGPRVCGGDPYRIESICDIFAANREGILGCIGYLAVYLFGEVIGYDCVWYPTKRQLEGNATTAKNTSATPQSAPRVSLFTVAVSSWALHGILTIGCGIPVSRRSTNSNFCVWVVAHNVSLLAIIQWTWHTTSTFGNNDASSSKAKIESPLSPSPPWIWSKLNDHGLIMFVIANLLTGLVNISIDTLSVADPIAILIVFIYIGVVGLVSVALDWPISLMKRNKRE